MGMMQVANSSFNARGLPRPALVISLLRGIVIGIPLTVAGDMLWGIHRYLPGNGSDKCHPGDHGLALEQAKCGGADSTFKTKPAPTLSQGDGQALVAVPEGGLFAIAVLLP